jgi:hypothetical protein
MALQQHLGGMVSDRALEGNAITHSRHDKTQISKRGYACIVAVNLTRGAVAAVKAV